MMDVGTFSEANAVRDYVRDLLVKRGWNYVNPKDLPRKTSDVLVEGHLKEALVRLNPEIKKDPDKADEVIYKLRAILLSVGTDGLVRANEEFTSWLKGEKSMPFGENNQHTTVRLIDFDDPVRNDFVVTMEYQVEQRVPKRADIVCLVNGIPLVIGECKTAVRPAISWLDAAKQISEDYELNIPGLFVPNVFSFGTEGKDFKYGSVRALMDIWAPWMENDRPVTLKGLEASMEMLRPNTLLDILANFTVFATDRKNRKIKIIARHQQYDAANRIVDRVVEGRLRKGLIWHFQGSGKSLLMVFAAQKLRLHPKLKSPTVMIVVDRIDLDTQITGTFNAADVPNMIPIDSREELSNLLKQDLRKIIITTIHKFAEARGVLNDRDNIIVMVDEAHRTQEGDLGLLMRAALPNAFFFGLTGTPIAKRDRNTFATFGSEEDKGGYMSRYSFEESIRDKATLPLHFEPRLLKMHVDAATIDKAVDELTKDLTEKENWVVRERAGKMATLIRSPDKVRKITEDIVQHYQTTVEPNGFKAMVVCYDRKTCVIYKEAFDEILHDYNTEIVMTIPYTDPQEWKDRWARKKDEEEKVLDKFQDPNDPLKILIVTSKLLTGFDAPILQTMYLDKVLKDHTLLQAICRTNRPYPKKTHGLIVDYIGVFDEIAKTLTYDEEGIRRSITNIAELKTQLPEAMKRCMGYFQGVDRSLSGHEGLIAAQDCLPNNERRDAFGGDYSILSKLWETIMPDPLLSDYQEDYIWLTHVYESIQPPSGAGALIWHILGAKTLEIIHENVRVESIRDDLDKIILDEEMIKELKGSSNGHKLVEIKITRRLRRHKKDPKFIALGEKLEELKEKYEQRFITSMAYLQALLVLAKEVLEAEREVDPEDDRKKAKTALTELFNETKTDATPAIIEDIVNSIDDIVRAVRFDGWQWTRQGEREVKKALRKELMRFKLHKEHALFDRAYSYIREYY